MIRTALLIISGNAFGSLLLLVRNLAIARLVSVEDYGIAATFAISMAVVEMASGLGLQQLIVQDKSGNDEKLQAGLHGFNLLRNILAAAVLFLLAGPIADFLGVPHVTWAYQLLALIPLMRGVEHFDIYRLNRQLTFGPLIVTKTVPAAISVAAIWPLYHAFGDYRVMLYAVLLQWALVSALSHLVARRRFSISLDTATMRRGWNFGWPLLLNNLLLFGVFQGDKLIVGHAIGIETLAIFAMGVTLTLTPTLVSAASEQQFYLPQLSALDDKEKFAPMAGAAMQTSLISGLLLVALIYCFGEYMVQILLGDKYAGLIPLLTWFAIWQAVRTFKVGGTIVALSRARTANGMIANGVRALVLPIAWYYATTGGDVLTIVWIATAGEAAGYIVSIALVSRQLKLNLRPMITPLIAALATLAFAATNGGLPEEFGGAYLHGTVVFGLVLLTFLSCNALRAFIADRKIQTLRD